MGAQRPSLLRATLACALLLVSGRAFAAPGERPPAEVVADIRRADYAGDRAALARLARELAPLPLDSRTAARVTYWRGFALWRRAINGFNDQRPDREDLERDLTDAAAAFEEARRRDAAFLDAAIGRYSCLSLIGFLNRNDRERLMTIAADIRPLAAALETSAADNPRWIWVHGQNEFVAIPGEPPDQREARRARVLASYERGIDLARRQRRRIRDPLEPAWGEAELQMSLAWSLLNQSIPDAAAAEHRARAALAAVPDWHYVRDVLLPQILKARGAPAR